MKRLFQKYDWFLSLMGIVSVVMSFFTRSEHMAIIALLLIVWARLEKVGGR